MPPTWRSRARGILLAGALYLGLASAAPAQGYRGWLPENLNDAYGGEIDALYFQILVVVAVMFFATEGVLLYSCVRYRARPGAKARYSHGSKKAELLWSILPGFVLLWLAFTQRDAWFRIRDEFPPDSEAVVVQVLPEQFQWNFRYAGPDGSFGTEDDVSTTGEMHVPVGKKIVTRMNSKDVIHSFFLPHLRVKQDVVPGMLTRVWFQADRIPCWDLQANEVVYLSPEEFDRQPVAVTPDWGDDYLEDEFLFGWNSDIPRNGMKTYKYDRPSSGQAWIHERGEVKRRPVRDAKLVLHFVEVACAELCGINHWQMRGTLVVEPEHLFQRWLAKKGKDTEEYGQSSEHERLWTNTWDAFHPEYNRKP
jgi:cytochrome c oxidase subunit 2